MNLKLVSLYNFFGKKQQAIIDEDLVFIDEINNYLLDEDLYICEEGLEPLFEIILIGSDGIESLFLKRLKDFDEPLVLLATAHNNSLSAALEIKTYLENQHKLCFLLTGDEKHIASMIRHIATIIHATKKLKKSRLGVIGGPFKGLIAPPIKPENIKKYFKMEVVKITAKEFDELYQKAKEETLAFNEVPREQELFNCADNPEALSKALLVYVALKKLVEKYQLHGLTIRSSRLIKKTKTTACLALALLNEEGISASGEGDLASLMTMHLVNTLTGRTSFLANPSKIDYEEHTLLLANSSVPFNMVSSYKLRPYFANGSGLSIKGELLEGHVSILKIAPDFSLENSLCLPGTIKENVSLPSHNQTQVLLSLSEESLMDLLKTSFGGQVVVAYGEVYQDFFPVLSLLRRE
ncbi:MAG: hypothetical protein GX813_03225 [Erysipelotrichia bacterium]|nr:hypothetical protein [Erysipelotrichia bacterium]